MFGKWVTIDLGEGVRCDVFVLCTPTTPDDVLQTRAFSQLASRLTQRAGDVAKASACGECPMLSIKEREQKRGEKHYCKKYNKQVFHMGLHPKIVRVPECDEPE